MFQMHLIDRKNQFIVHIEFTNEDQIRNAVMAAYMGNRYQKFSLKVLETISITCNEAA